jgi:hypothetical protein
MQRSLLSQIAAKQKRFIFWREITQPQLSQQPETNHLALQFKQKLEQYRETLYLVSTTLNETETDPEAISRITKTLLCLERELEDLENEARLYGRNSLAMTTD